jgi:hypothetical protein
MKDDLQQDFVQFVVGYVDSTTHLQCGPLMTPKA